MFYSIEDFNNYQDLELSGIKTYHAGARRINNIIKKYSKLHRAWSCEYRYYDKFYVWKIHFKNGTYVIVQYAINYYDLGVGLITVYIRRGSTSDECSFTNLKKTFLSFKEFDDELHDLSLILRPKNSRK